MNTKKLLIGISSILMLTFVVVLFVNADDLSKDSKKAKTEVKQDASGMQCQSVSKSSAGSKTVSCDPEKCKEANCVHKDGKCDPATCTAHKKVEVAEEHPCMKTSSCPKTCPGKME